MAGMIGMFIMHPKEVYRPPVDHDFGLILQEWALLPGNSVPNTANMEFNWLTINGVSAPMTTPMLVRLGICVLGRVPNMVTADAGYYSQALENAVLEKGVEGLAVPNRNTRSVERKKQEHSRWFRNAQRWRTGCEGPDQRA